MICLTYSDSQFRFGVIDFRTRIEENGHGRQWPSYDCDPIQEVGGLPECSTSYISQARDRARRRYLHLPS